MKKVFAILCIAGIAIPYYYIFKFIEANNWEWSTSLFFEQINLNYAMGILNADLTIAAISFLIFCEVDLPSRIVIRTEVTSWKVNLNFLSVN